MPFTVLLAALAEVPDPRRAQGQRYSMRHLLLFRAHWGTKNRGHYVRDVTLGEDASRIHIRSGVMARIRSVALNVLRANGVQNISLALYANTLSSDQLLAVGTA